jgi:hypothetical protein
MATVHIVAVSDKETEMIKTLAICYGLTEADIKPLKNGWFKMPWGRIRVVDGTVVKEIDD